MSEPLRVVIAGPYPREQGVRVGGVQVYSDYLSSGLASRSDVEVHVVTAVPHLDSVRHFRTPAGVSVHQVPLFHRYQFLTDSLINAPRMYRVIREIQPDIVHVQTSRLYPLAGLERGFPSLLTIHGIFFEESKLYKNQRDRFRGLYGRTTEKRSVGRARHVVCLNNYALSIMRPFIGTDDVRVIDNAVDDRFFGAQRAEEPGRVLFAGLITDRKNVLGLLEAAKIVSERVSGLRLRIAGHILDQAYFETCKAFVDANGLADSVEFVGNVSGDDIVGELAKANALVLPAKQETSPMIISESLAVGTPVIATPVGGMPEVVRDGETGFLVPLGDAQALADRITQLIEDSELRSRMSESARQLASERFSRSIVLQKTVDFYRDIIRQERGPM